MGFIREQISSAIADSLNQEIVNNYNKKRREVILIIDLPMFEKILSSLNN